MARVELPDSSLNYPGNSNTKTTESESVKPKAQKIVKGKVTTKKPSFGRKFKEVFFGDESADVKSYILLDVLIPAIKDTISDVVSGGLDMLLFGEHRNRGRRSNNTGSYVSYSSYYANGKQNQTRTRSVPSRGGSGYAVRDITFESRGEAEEVLGNMIDTIKDYGTVSVGDLYDMIGEPGVFTDNAWGWFDLGSASVRRVREGYMLILPRVVNLK